MTIFAVVILSPDSVLIRLVEDASPDVDSWTVLFWRGALYAVGVSTLVFLKYRSKTISEFKNIGKGGLLIGFFSGISTGTFVFAIVYTSIANALVIISTGPIMIAIVAWVLLREKSSLVTWISMVIVFIGILYCDEWKCWRQEPCGRLFRSHYCCDDGLYLYAD